MTSNLTNSLIRIAGFAITVILIVQPWLIKVDYLDPFFYSEWMEIIAAFVSLSIGSLLLSFYRPLKGYNNLTWLLLISFIAIAVSLYFTHYTVCFRISMIYIGLLACPDFSDISLSAMKMCDKIRSDSGIDFTNHT
ncbi:MAG: hypothetical protein IKP71_09515 [Candidatus Riflebacteria bacterium]|nr:hypothetical protein [Candidatus Riflebacteria bacterium]